jgi:hypothetical protein
LKKNLKKRNIQIIDLDSYWKSTVYWQKWWFVDEIQEFIVTFIGNGKRKSLTSTARLS